MEETRTVDSYHIRHSSSSLSQRHSTRKAVRRMCRPSRDLICPLSSHPLHLLRWMKLVPLSIRITNIKLSYRHCQNSLNIQRHQRLAKAIAWPKLEWPPCTLDRIQGMVRTDEPSLWEERVRLLPVIMVALDDSVHDPDGHSVRGISVAIRIYEVYVWTTGSDGCSGWKEAQGFFYDGESVGKLVDELFFS